MATMALPVMSRTVAGCPKRPKRDALERCGNPGLTLQAIVEEKEEEAEEVALFGDEEVVLFSARRPEGSAAGLPDAGLEPARRVPTRLMRAAGRSNLLGGLETFSLNSIFAGVNDPVAEPCAIAPATAVEDTVASQWESVQEAADLTGAASLRACAPPTPRGGCLLAAGLSPARGGDLEDMCYVSQGYVSQASCETQDSSGGAESDIDSDDEESESDDWEGFEDVSAANAWEGCLATPKPEESPLLWGLMHFPDSSGAATALLANGLVSAGDGLPMQPE